MINKKNFTNKIKKIENILILYKKIFFLQKLIYVLVKKKLFFKLDFYKNI